jgi:hypothetical protein
LRATGDLGTASGGLKKLRVRALGRREFIAGLSATIVAGSSVRAQTHLTQIVVDYESDGRPIAPDFIGLSHESAILSPGSYFTPDNATLIALLRALGSAGVLRIGGNTSERTVWEPAGAAAPDGIAITSPAIDRLAASLRAVSWKLIYGLNLARGTPEAAAEEAAYVARALGPLLLAFQIGNEPDGFGRWTRVRPPTYDFATFLAEWMRFAAAIRARVSNASFAGPDIAVAPEWVPAFAAAAPPGLVLLTQHHYAEGPAGDPMVSLPRLLQASGDIEPTLSEASRAARLPYRIAETNSVFNEGEPGVSDTLGAALWGLDLMFRCAAADCAGVNFHAGDHNLQPGRNKGLYAGCAHARRPPARRAALLRHADVCSSRARGAGPRADRNGSGRPERVCRARVRRQPACLPDQQRVTRDARKHRARPTFRSRIGVAPDRGGDRRHRRDHIGRGGGRRGRAMDADAARDHRAGRRCPHDGPARGERRAR